MNDSDKLKYIELARSGMPPNEFYATLKKEGVGKFDIFVLLRDEYSLGLVQCNKIAEDFQQTN